MVNRRGQFAVSQSYAVKSAITKKPATAAPPSLCPRVDRRREQFPPRDISVEIKGEGAALIYTF